MLKGTILKNLFNVILLTMGGMTAYEVIKHLMYPEMGVWTSSVITIIFTAFMATSVAFFFIRKSAKMKEQLDHAISQHQKVESELVLVNNLSKSLVKSSLDIIIAVDINRNIIEFNEAAQKAYGYSADEVLGKSIDIIYADAQDSLMVHESMIEEGQFIGEVVNKTKSGETFPSFLSAAILLEPDAEFSGYMGISRDISERKKFEQELELAATTDKLTGLHNRYKFDEMLSIETARAERYKSPLSIILFDLDHFKLVNDTHGHQVGNHVLSALADLVKTHIRKTDYFARWGGEEFIILSPETAQKEALDVTEKIRGLIEEHSFEESVKVTISCGITEFKEKDTIDSFIKRVDDALYRAKSKGRNTIEVEH